MIDTMPKKKAASDGSEKQRPQRSGVALNSYIDEDVRGALDDFLAEYNENAEHPASIRSSLEAALKAYLAPKGHWPRKKK